MFDGRGFDSQVELYSKGRSGRSVRPYSSIYSAACTRSVFPAQPQPSHHLHHQGPPPKTQPCLPSPKTGRKSPLFLPLCPHLHHLAALSHPHPPQKKPDSLGPSARWNLRNPREGDGGERSGLIYHPRCSEGCVQKMHHIKAKRQRRNEFSVGPFRISDIAVPTFAKRTPDCLITRPSFISCNKG